MSNLKQWLRLEPLDTLFFRGSEPMLAGESHEVASRFPPTPSTLVGALATAILSQRGLLRAWAAGNVTSITPNYPLLGEPPLPGEPYRPGFQVAGPLLLAPVKNGHQECFLPAPAHWFANPEEKGKEKILQVQQADLLPEAALKLGLTGSVPEPVWVREPRTSDLESLAGCWVNPAAFAALKAGSVEIKQFHTLEEIPPGVPALMEQKALAEREPRMGLALEPQRRPRRGHLYLAAHQRLAPGVSLLVGISEIIAPHYLNPSGLMQLGGENRLVRYEVLAEPPPLPQGDGPWLLALSHFPFQMLKTWGLDRNPRVSGPLIRLAGWDLKHGFHKPVTAYLPAGSVIHAPEVKAPFGFLPL